MQLLAYTLTSNRIRAVYTRPTVKRRLAIQIQQVLLLKPTETYNLADTG